MAKKLIVIGHIVNDTEPSPHPGGAVAYAGIAASYLGAETYIFTKCPKDDPYIELLESYGVSVHRLPSKKNTITTFQNFYNKKGERKQIVLAQQESIYESDLGEMPKEILKDAIILVGTVIGEVDLKLYPKLAELGMLAVAAQGYFRKVEKDGSVAYQEWEGFEKYLSFAKIVVLSQEDLTLRGVFQEKLLQKLRGSCRIAVITQGERGAIVYEQGKNTVTTSAFPLEDIEIKDFTGAGDTYASAFLIFYQQFGDTKIASVLASLYAAIKITGMDGIGIDSIPTKLQVALFFHKRETRVAEFLKENSVATHILHSVFQDLS